MQNKRCGFWAAHAEKLFPLLNRWQVQRKVVAIPKSVTPARIQQNLQVSINEGKELQQCPFHVSNILSYYFQSNKLRRLVYTRSSVYA